MPKKKTAINIQNWSNTQSKVQLTQMNNNNNNEIMVNC